MKHSIIQYTSVLLIIAFATGCKQDQESVKSTNSEKKQEAQIELKLSDEQIRQGNITVVPVETAPINSTVTLNGLIDVPPQNMVSITCPLGGYVQSINLLPGQEVSKGEVLVTMEDPAYVQLQQDYLVTKSKLGFLEKEYNRQKELSATDATSRKNLEQVTAEFQAEKAILQGLNQKLALIGINGDNLNVNNLNKTISIRSPIHGFVSKVPVNRGRYIGPTEIMAELIDPGDIHASLTVFEKDIPYIKKGQHVNVRLVSKPGINFPAEVLLVSRNLDEGRTGMVHCHFHKYAKELVPGMAVTAAIELEQQNLPAVPEEAVLLFQGKHYVFVETSKNVFRLTEVVPGQKENGLVALTNSDKDWLTTKVVSAGAFKLLGTIMKNEEE